MQADRLTKYADWAALQVSGKKTKITGITGILHKAKQTGIYKTDPSQHLQSQVKEKVFVQGQHAQFIRDTDPFKLGVTLSMSLSWSYQHKCMTYNLTHKLNALSKSYSSPSQTKRIISTAIIPSLAYSFPVVPCTPSLINRWDQKAGHCVKKKLGMDRTTPSTAIIREHTQSFGLGYSSVGVEYHTHCAEALIKSLNCTSPRHA